MKKGYLISFLLSLFIFPICASAECSSERLAELSKIAENVNIDYTYEMVDGTPDITIVASNLTGDIYLQDDIFGSQISGVGEKVLLDYALGTNVVFTIYSNDNSCKNQALLTKYLNLPTYNQYSTDERCITYPDFKYCKVWLDTSGLEYTEFDKQFEEYIKNKIDNDSKDKKDVDKTTLDKVVDFVLKNKIIIALGILVIVGAILFVINKKKKTIL